MKFDIADFDNAKRTIEEEVEKKNNKIKKIYNNIEVIKKTLFQITQNKILIDEIIFEISQMKHILNLNKDNSKTDTAKPSSGIEFF